MDAWIWIVIAVVVVLAIALIVMRASARRRHRHLEGRFGSEAEPAVGLIEDYILQNPLRAGLG